MFARRDRCIRRRSLASLDPRLNRVERHKLTGGHIPGMESDLARKLVVKFVKDVSRAGAGDQLVRTRHPGLDRRTLVCSANSLDVGRFSGATGSVFLEPLTPMNNKNNASSLTSRRHRVHDSSSFEPDKKKLICRVAHEVP